MDFEEINLKLYLDYMGIQHDNYSLENRIRVQKAVFIGQCAGIEMLFHYEWGNHGPCSRDLIPVHYRFNRHYNNNERDYEKYSLKSTVSNRISEFKSILIPPKDFEGKDYEWMELIASILFLMSKYYDEDRVRKLFKNKQDQDWVNIAFVAIKDINLFNKKYFKRV